MILLDKNIIDSNKIENVTRFFYYPFHVVFMSLRTVSFSTSELGSRPKSDKKGDEE